MTLNKIKVAIRGISGLMGIRLAQLINMQSDMEIWQRSLDKAFQRRDQFEELLMVKDLPAYTCSICLPDEEATKGIQLHCGHSFHLRCFLQLLKNSSLHEQVSCPNCRSSLYKDSVNTLTVC